MLTIFLHGHDYENETPFFYEGSTAELFRTVRVTNGYHAFVEVGKGHLINIAHIERIAEDEVEEPPSAVEMRDGVPTARPALPDQAGDDSGVVKRDVAATPIPGGPPSCPHGYIKGTCSICTPAFTGVPKYVGKQP